MASATVRAVRRRRLSAEHHLGAVAASRSSSRSSCFYKELMPNLQDNVANSIKTGSR